MWANRSKESLTLDLKRPEALAVLRRCSIRADVLVQNLAPGAADRMGLGYDTLHRELPRLIVCGISGYGPDGPYRDQKAYDLMVQAEAGFVGITGTPDAPVKAGIAIADIAAGTQAHAAILAALLQRATTGQGCRIDIAMLDCMVEWMGFPLYYAFDGAEPPPRAGAAHASIYPYGPFATGDGGTVLLGVQNEREWQGVLRPGAGATGTCHGSALRHQRRAQRDADLAARRHRSRLRHAVRRGSRRAPRARADRACAREHAARGVGASAARGAPPLGRGGDAGWNRASAAAAGGARALLRSGWIRYPRWVRTPTPSCGRWVTTRTASRACGTSARSEERRRRRPGGRRVTLHR